LEKLGPAADEARQAIRMAVAPEKMSALLKDLEKKSPVQYDDGYLGPKRPEPVSGSPGDKGSPGGPPPGGQ
jgi:hypothetical protein